MERFVLSCKRTLHQSSMLRQLTLHMLCQFVLLMLCVMGPWGFSVQAEQTDLANARIIQVSGVVKAENLEDGTSRPLMADDTVLEGERIVTEIQSKATVNMNGDLLIYLDAQTVLVIENFKYYPMTGKGNIGLTILKGTLGMATHGRYNNKHRPLVLKTPSAHIGVRGTRFWVNASADYSQRKQQKLNTLVEFICLRPSCVLTNDVDQRVISKPNQVMVIRSRLEKLPEPRQALPEELEFLKDLMPGLFSTEDEGGPDAAWFTQNLETDKDASSQGKGKGKSNSKNVTKDKDKDEKKEKNKPQIKKRPMDDKTVFALIVFALVILALIIIGVRRNKKK